MYAGKMQKKKVACKLEACGAILRDAKEPILIIIVLYFSSSCCHRREFQGYNAHCNDSVTTDVFIFPLGTVARLWFCFYVHHVPCGNVHFEFLSSHAHYSTKLDRLCIADVFLATVFITVYWKQSAVGTPILFGLPPSARGEETLEGYCRK